MLIRTEGLQHSHVMEYGSGLADGIGPRLTGSPNMKKANEWTRDQLAQMGCVNAHLEDWGEFGMGWRQNNTWLRMASPDTAVMMGQATPWSPATNGAVTGDAVWVHYDELKDLDLRKGQLAGKIVSAGRHAGSSGAGQGIQRALHGQRAGGDAGDQAAGPASGPGGDMRRGSRGTCSG